MKKIPKKELTATKTKGILIKICIFPLYLINKIADFIVRFFLFFWRIYNKISEAKNILSERTTKIRWYKYIYAFSKIVFLYLFLSLIIFTIVIIVLFIILNNFTNIIFPLTDEIINDSPFLDIKFSSYLIIFSFLMILFSYIIFTLFRNRERFLFISLRIYFYIIIIFSIFFYFVNFRYDYVNMINIPDEYFTSMYNKNEVKDSENIYYYLRKHHNPDYYDDSEFSSYKIKRYSIIDGIEYNGFMNDIYEAIWDDNVLQYKYLLNNKNWDKILKLWKWNQDFVKYLNNYSKFDSKEYSFYGFYNNRMSLIKYYENSQYDGFDKKFYDYDKKLIISRLYLLSNLEKNNRNEVIDYFLQNYKLSFNIIYWNAYIWDNAVVLLNDIPNLNKDLLYVKNNYNYTPEELLPIYKLLEENYNKYDSKKLYKNQILNDYKLARKIFDENPEMNNFIFDKEKSIKLLKNKYYAFLTAKDYSQESIKDSILYRDLMTDDMPILEYFQHLPILNDIIYWIDCWDLRFLRKNFVGTFITELYFSSNVWVIDSFDDIKLDLEKTINELKVIDEKNDIKDINYIINNSSSKTLFEEWGEHIFNEIHDKFYDKDEKWNKFITDESMKIFKEKMLEENWYWWMSINNIDIMPTYFNKKKWFRIYWQDWEPEARAYRIIYWED